MLAAPRGDVGWFWSVPVFLVIGGFGLRFANGPLETLMAYPLGGDSSKYSYVSFAVSFVVIVLLSFVWRERLVNGDRDVPRIRQALMVASLWAASASALGQVVFSLYRWFHPSHFRIHDGPVLVFALSGLVISAISLLGVFAAGPKRWLVAFSGLVLTCVWFLAALDNMNW